MSRAEETTAEDAVVNAGEDEANNDSSERDVEPARARAIIEAILMSAADPVTPGRLTHLLTDYNGRGIRELIDSLNAQYEDGGHGVEVAEVAGGFQLASRQEFGPWLRKYHKTSNQIRLSQAGLEALAIVAFKQPVTRIEIDQIRGVNSGGVLHTLMEVDMVRIVGRSEGIGKPMLFGTTREFLIHFGLKGLSELPKPKELDELLAEGQHKAEALQLALELDQLQKQAADGGEEKAEEYGNENAAADEARANDGDWDVEEEEVDDRS